MIGSSTAEARISRAGNDASFALARHFLVKAIESGHDNAEGKKYGQKLERLSKTTLKSMGIFTRTNSASILLGAWLQFSGGAREAHAFFRAQVQEALQILSNDNPDSDTTGYTNLLTVFLVTGDDKNDISICSVHPGNMGNPPETRQTRDRKISRY